MQAEWMPMRFVKLLNKTFKMSEDKAAEGLLFQTYLAIAVFKMKLFIIITYITLSSQDVT
jgi:hypothetical protein